MNQELNDFLKTNYPVLMQFIIPILIWTLFWKGLALWHAAKKSSFGWFVAILLVNTFGLLEIGYLLWLKSKGVKIFG